MKTFEHFPWGYIEENLAMGDEPHWDTVLKFVKEEYEGEVTPCPICNTAANDLTWLPVATCEESWDEDQGAVGYLTICLTCHQQVDFLLEEICTEIEVETRRETGGSTFSLTWRRADH